MASPSSTLGRRPPHVQHAKSSSSYYVVASVGAGLLSSSCCAIQLLLNAFSISCAGFSILNPYRPLFLVLTFGVIAVAIWKFGFFTRPSLTTLLLALLLSASPEFLRLYNEGGGVARDDRRVEEVFEMEIRGMSCQACANKVKLQIGKQEGVVGCEVFLDEKKAIVRSRPGTFRSGADLESAVLAAAGYGGVVVKRYNSTSIRSAGLI